MSTTRLTALLAAALIAAGQLPAAEQEEGALEGGVPRAEIGFVVGAGTLDDDLVTGTASVGKVVPLLGVRGAYRLGRRLNWFADANVTRTATELAPGNVEMVTARTGLEFWLAPGKRARWFFSAAAGFAEVDFESNADFHRPLASVGVGQRWQIRRDASFRWELRADRLVGSSGIGGVEIDGAQLLVGWSLGFGKARVEEGPREGGPPKERAAPPDADGDGVPDRRDACPLTPAGARVDGRGCPSDEDGDGVPDGLDRCPGTPPRVRVDEAGCPLDADGDGVPDSLDRCPGTQRGATVNAAGCPSDTDGDGVPDGLDRCPGTPPWARADENGCPRDGDGDGVPDGLDRCPDTPAGTKVNAEGCPETPATLAPLAEGRPLVLEGVHFELNRAELTPESRTILDRVAESLKAWPDLRVEIAGHTDSTGRVPHNLDLSRRRAEAVRDYLVRAGVRPSRLVAAGYGQGAPVADNGTPEGRARNRRVELTRIGP